jgi:hypothetical protein
MRKWGIVITLVYALFLLGFLVPVLISLSGFASDHPQGLLSTLTDLSNVWIVWLTAGLLAIAEGVLLFLSVDTSQKRLKPRSNILISYSVTAFLFALLMFAGLSSLGAAVYNDKFIDRFWPGYGQVLACVAGLWLLWAAVFFLYFRNAIPTATRLVSWLLRGSILELLIAVPCHVMVRRRDDCSAPVATSFGIVTGIAVMFLSFGPSVLLLYKKRMDAYSIRSSV